MALVGAQVKALDFKRNYGLVKRGHEYFPMQSCLFQGRQVYSAGFFVTVSLVSIGIASSHGGEHRKTYGTNLSALFTMQVPPFKAVLMNTIPNVHVLSYNMAEVLRCRSPFGLLLGCSLRDTSLYLRFCYFYVILYLASLESRRI